MQKEAKPRQNSNQCRNNLTTRLQQIVELLYKNNGQFSKGLPSQQQFQQMLMHSYNCYDQLDFIILDYSKHSVNYLDPKTIAEHMHRIMRFTKYLFSNIRHWVESYSLDIVKKVSEERTFFPAEIVHQARCISCKRYVEQMVLKEAREEILGCYDMRELFEQELRQAKEQEKSQKPLTAKETTEYVGSVNFLTRVIREMEESAHEYSKLTENIEKEDTNEEIALRYLEDLLSTMHKRIGEKCFYRLKRVIKNWQKAQNQQSQNISKKPLFKIKQIINENYFPNDSNDKKNQKTSFSNVMLKRLKQENHQLQVQYNTINCQFNAAKNSLAFLEKRQENHVKEIQRLNDILSQNNIETNSIANERKDQRRNTIKNQAGVTIHSPQLTASVNTYAKQKKLTASQKASKYSKFKVKKMSRQSQILSNSTNKTLDLTYGQFSAQNRETEQNELSDQQQSGTVDVGVQWQEQLASERASKTKEKNSRNSKAKKISNRQRMPIAKVSKIQQQNELSILQKDKNNSSKDKKNSRILLDNNIKSRSNLNLKKDNRSSLEEAKLLRKQSTTIRKLLENQQQKVSLAQLGQIKQIGTNQKVSVKVLQGEPSTNKISLQKINIYSSNSKHRQLKPIPFQNKGFVIKDLPEANNQNHFSKQIKKILNMRMATEGNQVKKKILKVRNALFKPQNLELFGGVSESYSYEHSNDIVNLQQTAKGYFSELKSYLTNLRSFKNHLYDNIVLFMKSPFTLIDKDEMEINLVGDKQLTAYIKKFIGFHQRKCQKIPCQHLQQFDSIIGLAHFQ